jgi:hypothetical protein
MGQICGAIYNIMRLLPIMIRTATSKLMNRLNQVGVNLGIYFLNSTCNSWNILGIIISITMCNTS